MNAKLTYAQRPVQKVVGWTARREMGPKVQLLGYGVVTVTLQRAYSYIRLGTLAQVH